MPPCPHCGGHIQSTATTLRRRRMAARLCVDCNAPLSSAELVKRHIRCFTCRAHISALKQRRRMAAA